MSKNNINSIIFVNQILNHLFKKKKYAFLPFDKLLSTNYILRSDDKKKCIQ